MKEMIVVINSVSSTPEGAKYVTSNVYRFDVDDVTTAAELVDHISKHDGILEEEHLVADVNIK